MLSIRERGLYREKGYPTFEQYTREEWGISKQHAHRMMHATTAVGRAEWSNPRVTVTAHRTPRQTAHKNQ